MTTFIKQELIWIFLSLFIRTSQAQVTKPAQLQNETHSLYQQLKKARTAVAQTDVLLHLASAYIDRSQTDSAQYALNRGFRVVEKTPYATGEYFLLSYQTELLDKGLVFDEAFRYAFNALQKAQSIGDRELIGDSYTLLGLLYNDSGQPKPAIHCLRKSLRLLPLHSHQIHAVSQRYHALLNLGQCYLKLRQHKLAVGYLEQALHEAAWQQDFRVMAICSRLAGNAFMEHGQYARSKQQYLAGLGYALTIRDWDAALLFYPALFQLCYRENKRPEAMTFLRTGLRLVEQTPGRIATLPRKNFYAELVPIYQLLGNYAKAVRTQQTILAITEQINRQNNRRQLALLQAFNKQEQNLLLLTAERANQRVMLDQKKVQNAALWWSLTLLTVVFGASLYSFRQRRKLEQLRQQQHLAELEQQRQVDDLRAMLIGEEQERNRLAHELHNGIGGLLISARYSLERQEYINGGAGWADPIALVNEAYQEVRRVSHNLMPHVLQHDGLVAALAQYGEIVCRTTKVQLGFQAYDMPDELDPILELWLYRIVQELVSNTLKHASATTALVQLTCTNACIQLTVEDNGRGFRVADALKRDGMGLRQLIERTGSMHGTVAIESEAGLGTSILIELPVSLPVGSLAGMANQPVSSLQLT